MSADGLNDDQSQYRPGAMLLRGLIGIAVGIVPGALIAYFGSQRIGLAVMLIGIPIGVVMAFGCAGPLRSIRLLIAVLVARNLPFLFDSAWDWVDKRSAPSRESVAASDRLRRWLEARDVGERRGRLVLAALVAGIVAGGTVTARDVAALRAGQPGLVLPLIGARGS